MIRTLLLGVLPLMTGLACSSCQEEKTVFSPDPMLTSADVEVIHDVVTLYSDSMQLQARIDAAKLVKYTARQDPRDEFPEGVKVTFYDQQGQVSSTLVADFGVREAKKKEIKVIGNVVFRNIEGEQLETEELIWDEARKLVYTQKFVLITTPEEKIWGMGFEANQDFSRRRIFAPEGRVSVEGLPE
ncbi:MAG: LPS export ABC transporter periplasmic protein LptC [Saprospiraceae bacterium]|nr:LPS export ABC transporter periplasmic protein LptC [Saprospiraceae bacterium]